MRCNTLFHKVLSILTKHFGENIERSQLLYANTESIYSLSKSIVLLFGSLLSDDSIYRIKNSINPILFSHGVVVGLPRSSREPIAHWTSSKVSFCDPFTVRSVSPSFS